MSGPVCCLNYPLVTGSFMWSMPVLEILGAEATFSSSFLVAIHNKPGSLLSSQTSQSSLGPWTFRRLKMVLGAYLFNQYFLSSCKVVAALVGQWRKHIKIPVLTELLFQEKRTEKQVKVDGLSDLLKQIINAKLKKQARRVMGTVCVHVCVIGVVVSLLLLELLGGQCCPGSLRLLVVT